MVVDRSHLEDSLPASLFKVCDLNDDGEDLHQVDQANDGDKDRHLHHERAGCHETAEGQEPVSPMNTFAGYTLNSKKPNRLPTTAPVIGLNPAVFSDGNHGEECRHKDRNNLCRDRQGRL